MLKRLRVRAQGKFRGVDCRPEIGTIYVPEKYTDEEIELAIKNHFILHEVTKYEILNDHGAKKFNRYFDPGASHD